MTTFRAKTTAPGYVALYEKVGEDWKMVSPLLDYDFEFDTKRSGVIGTIRTRDMTDADPLGDEARSFLDDLNCPFEIHVQKPCKTKPFTEIELPPGATPVQIDWKDDDGEWHNFFEKKPKRSKWHNTKRDLPPKQRSVLMKTTTADNADYYVVAKFTGSLWESCETRDKLCTIDGTWWRELPKPPRESK